MNEFQKFSEQVNLILLIPHGRAGSFFIQSLLDNHEQIIAFPSYFRTYGWSFEEVTDLDRFSRDFCRSHIDFFDSAHSYVTDLNWVSPNLLGENKNEGFLIDRILFETRLATTLNELRKEGRLNDKMFLIALHYHLAELLNRNLHKIKYILFHQHGGRTYSPHVDRLLSDFQNLYFIAAVRDLRESYAGFKGLLAKRWGRQNFFNFFVHYLRLNLHLYHEFLKYRPRFAQGHVRIVDLHRLHLLQKGAVDRLALWLNLEIRPTLYESTFLGKKWWGNASDGKPIEGFSEKKALFTWKEKLSPREIRFIEYFTANLFEPFGHEPPATHPTRKEIYLSLLLGAPLLNRPRRDSLLLRNVSENPAFKVHPFLEKLPFSSKRFPSLFYNSCYLAAKSLWLFFMRLSWNEIKLFEDARRRVPPVSSSLKADLI